jgi:uncharacterized protein YecT (DUF1311 family)
MHRPSIIKGDATMLKTSILIVTKPLMCSAGMYNYIVSSQVFSARGLSPGTFRAMSASGLLLASLCLAGPAMSQQPSFNCATNRAPDEVTICGSIVLSRLDLELSAQYATVRKELDSAQQSILRESQRYWLSQRASCGYSEGCINNLYRQRIGQLIALQGSRDSP